MTPPRSPGGAASWANEQRWLLAAYFAGSILLTAVMWRAFPSPSGWQMLGDVTVAGAWPILFMCWVAR